MTEILGIDVGATGIKGAMINLEKGELTTERIKYLTPKPANAQSILDTVKKLVADFQWEGKPIGFGFPSIIKNGVCHSASNIDKSLIGKNLQQVFSEGLGCKTFFINDADAAGIAEMEFGVGKENKSGVTILLTLGTGIGSAVFHDGKLLPNTEFGQLKWKDSVTEKYAANSVRENNEMKWKDWAPELNEVLQHFEFIFSPDLIILGGGVSKKFDKYKEYLDLKCDIQPATMRNNAGIIGAAMAYEQYVERQEG